jgi:hypothetical protein
MLTPTKFDKLVTELKGVATKEFVSKDVSDLKASAKDDIISLQRWMIGLFITLALMIAGLYFKK